MSKKQKGSKIKNFSRDEEEEIIEALEEANNEKPSVNGSNGLRAVKTFTGIGANALNEASRDQYEDEDERKAGERYQNDLSGLNNLAGNASNKVQNMESMFHFCLGLRNL